MTRTATARAPKRASPKTTAASRSRPDPVAILLPQLAAHEKYRGLVLDEQGEASHHLILVAVSDKGMTHGAALEWAKKLGADLAERNEGALLYANNADGAVDKERGPYWLKPQYAGTAEYAWYQYFSNGYQTIWHKSLKLRAVAGRRVPIR